MEMSSEEMIFAEILQITGHLRLAEQIHVDGGIGG
jgi:cytoskeletal protein CcmA (bactofilin family)